MNFNNSRLVDHKQMKFGTFVPYMYRFVIIVKYLTNLFKLERNLGIKFTLRFFFLSAHPTCALLGSNLDCTVAMLVVRCYCLPGNPDKHGQHVVGHCPAAESDYVVAQAGLQQDARSHPYTLLRSYCPQK